MNTFKKLDLSVFGISHQLKLLFRQQRYNFHIRIEDYTHNKINKKKKQPRGVAVFTGVAPQKEQKEKESRIKIEVDFF